MIIETNRLFLREMTENDFEALYKVLSDSDVMKHYPYTFDENRVREWIITLFKRAPELTEDQEKKLHQLSRKVRKKFGMKPIRM